MDGWMEKGHSFHSTFKNINPYIIIIYLRIYGLLYHSYDDLLLRSCPVTAKLVELFALSLASIIEEVWVRIPVQDFLVAA